MAAQAVMAAAVQALLLSLLVTVTLAKGVPHVSTCNFCEKCHVGTAPPTNAERRSLLHGRQQAPIADLDPEQLFNRQPGESKEQRVARRRQLRSWLQRSISHVEAAEQASLQQEQADIAALAESDSPDPGKAYSARRNVLADILHFTANNFLSTAQDTVPKQSMGNCTECWGCNTELQHMDSEASFFNNTYVNERGATSSWLFKATTNATVSGTAVLKVYCVPIAKRVGGKTPNCSPLTVFKNMQLFQALEAISEDCGLDDIIPKVWVSPVNAVIPDIGYHIRWWGLWQELIQGVSLENFLHKGIPRRLDPNIVLDVLHNQLNKTQVVRAAIFDLLTSQCDRHSQNIFINEQGQLHLIDNEACLQNNWKTCGFDSIFIPTTQKQEIMRLSNQFVLKYVKSDAAPHGVADPQLLLDYRCYVGGKEVLGTDYPPQVVSCLKKISGMSVKEVQIHYGLPDGLPATNLHTRATDMLNKGYEWSYKYGEPRNAPPKRYLVQPKCCRVTWEVGRFRCAHEWEPKFELPIGDPVTGRNWEKAKPDTGTFEGGTRH